VRASLLIRKALPIARRRARWLVRPPRVRGSLPPPFPGGGRIAEAEELAAVEAVREVLRSKRLFRYGGPLPRSRAARLEKSFAAAMGARHALALNSGTSALVCALAAMEVGPGDEVIVPAFTWISTATAVLDVGATPVIAEVDASLTLDPDDARAKLSPRTRAIVPVHMRGAPAAMDRIVDLAEQHGLLVLEDAAQAVGASFRGRRLGTIGHAGAYSFHMAKVITAGEGGMLVTGDAALHRRAAMHHDPGAPVHLGVSAEEWRTGLNFRMSELQAAVALVQLERLDELLRDMRASKRRLKELTGGPLRARGVEFRTLHDADGDAAVALVFFLPDAARTERVVSALADQNVPAGRLCRDGRDHPHDYVDLHAYPYWTPLVKDVERPEGACPRTMALLRRAVHVDVSPDLTAAQVEQMAAAVVSVVEEHI
jgi:dTDP-4-amino-4,6-dideoxygalactose transaminase